MWKRNILEALNVRIAVYLAKIRVFPKVGIWKTGQNLSQIRMTLILYRRGKKYLLWLTRSKWACLVKLVSSRQEKWSGCRLRLLVSLQHNPEGTRC